MPTPGPSQLHPLTAALDGEIPAEGKPTGLAESLVVLGRCPGV